MSYISQGAAFILAGLVILVIPFIGLILGMLIIALSVVMLAFGLSNPVPGQNAGLCGIFGHDWRNNLPGMPPGNTCRNCLRRPGAGGMVLMAPYPPGQMAPPLPPAPCPRCRALLMFGTPVCPACGMPLRW